MSDTTITALGSSATTSPVAIEGYQARRQSKNIVYDLIGGGIAVTLISPRPRSGRLVLVYDNEADAFAALALHAEETVFTLARFDMPAVDMAYVLDDTDVEIEQGSTGNFWRVSVGYQEVDL